MTTFKEINEKIDGKFLYIFLSLHGHISFFDQCAYRLIFIDFERINHVILHPSHIWIFVGTYA
jgi:hypothetical protein